ADLGQVDTHGPGAYAVVGRPPRQVGDAGAGDHRLGGGAALVDAGAADVGPLHQGGLAPRLGQRPGQRPAGLPRADHDRVVLFRSHDTTSLGNGRSSFHPRLTSLSWGETYNASKRVDLTG